VVLRVDVCVGIAQNVFEFLHAFLNNFRGKVDVLRNVENELKTTRALLSDKEDQLIFVQKSLDRERDEKMAVLDEKSKEEEEWQVERNHWQVERQEMKQQVTELAEATKNDKNTRLNELEANEINQALHKVIKDKEALENENALLRQEIKRLQMIIANPNEIDHLQSYAIDEDYGYSSNRNTLEKPHHKHSSSQLSEGEFQSLSSNIQSSRTPHAAAGTSSTFERKLKSLFGFSQRGGKRQQSYFLIRTNNRVMMFGD